MSDGSHSKAVRLQALALIIAALLTTTGAVTSAFIQSGWFKTPAAAVAMDVPQLAPRAQAMFTGGIEPLDAASLAVTSPSAAKSSAMTTGSFSTDIVEQNETVPTAFYEAVPKAKLQVRSEPSFHRSAVAPAVAGQPRVEVPRVLAAPTISKPLMSNGNWFSGIVPTIFSQPAPRPTAGSASANTAKPKPTNWTPLPR